MQMVNKTSMLLAGVLLVCAAVPPAIQAQTSTGGNLTELPLPRNNVKAGALSANAPGNWVKAGVTNHTDFNTKAFDQFGGATIDAPTEDEASLKQQMLPVLVDAFLNALDSLVATIQAAILAGGTITTTNPA